MIRSIHRIIPMFGILAATLVRAESNFPVDEPTGGELLGHSVTEIGDGLCVFRCCAIPTTSTI